MSLTANNTTSTTTDSKPKRPSLIHSKTLPALKQAFHVVEKPLASIGASSTKGLRRMSLFYKRKSSSPSTPHPTPTIEPCPEFTTPNYAEETTSSTVAPADISPLARPLFKRASSAPLSTPLWTLCERPMRKSSMETVSSVSTIPSASSLASSSPSPRRRRSSASSTTVFIVSEDPVPGWVRFQVYVYAVFGLLFSLVCVLLIRLFPRLAPKHPGRELVLRRHNEREIIISEEQLLHPPSPPKLRRTKRIARVANAILPRRASSSKVVRLPVPTPVDITTLSSSDVSCFVDSPPDVRPLPKGPAPQVRPHTVRASRRKPRWCNMLPTVKEGEVLDPALCPGW
ncbi:hypothetical protein FB45DRAFT_910322, partial [Roridomyces roridus]